MREREGAKTRKKVKQKYKKKERPVRGGGGEGIRESGGNNGK